MELKTENGILLDFEGLVKYAEQGDAEAQYDLGLAYGEGRVVKKNYSEMAEWLNRSAKQGYDKAVFFLGICYYLGKGVRKNRKKTFGLLEESALAGNKESEKTLKKLRDYDCIEK